MNADKNIGARLNDAPKLFKAALLTIPFLFIFVIYYGLDNDAYWIIKTGEYICNNGFPTKDFLTIHSSMDLVVQQWLADVLYYKLYTAFGVFGPMLFVYVCYTAFVFLLYKLYMIFSDNFFVSAVALIVSCVYIALGFEKTRPQALTYVLIICELIAIEKFVRTDQKIYLAVLPVISVLLINWHSSMWTMQFILMAPYFANALPIKYKGKKISCCKMLPLLLASLACVLCGLISPYGVKAMAFIFTTSIGGQVNSSITELLPLTVTHSLTRYHLALVIVVALVFSCYKKGKVSIRSALLVFGTALMTLAYVKLFPYFLIAGIAPTAEYLSGVDVVIKPMTKKGRSAVAATLAVAAVALVGYAAVTLSPAPASDSPENASVSSQNTESESSDLTYAERLSGAAEALDKEDKQGMVLYNDFNAGAYLEFLGYKTYIDPRADSFVKAANHDFDYLTEYNNLEAGKIYYKDVFNKYNFTHAVIDVRISAHLLLSLERDADFELIYRDTEYAVYKRV